MSENNVRTVFQNIYVFVLEEEEEMNEEVVLRKTSKTKGSSTRSIHYKF